jgi:AcrR family transcriptional regulator
METGTKSKRKKSNALSGADIIHAYKTYLLLHGKPPHSVFHLTTQLSITEEAFYEYFASFEALEKALWLGMLETTQVRLTEEPAYATYTSREKLLAFYFTLMEEFLKERSYIHFRFKHSKKPDVTPYFLDDFRPAFLKFVQSILDEGTEKEEVLSRPFVSDRYAHAIWVQFLFLLHFWIKDDSKGFEKTDAAVEKSVNLAFDLMGRGPLDSILDMARFLYQNR